MLLMKILLWKAIHRHIDIHLIWPIYLLCCCTVLFMASVLQQLVVCRMVKLDTWSVQLRPRIPEVIGCEKQQ